MGSFGVEFLDAPGSRLAYDVQWNPALTRVRRWGPYPGYSRESTPWEWSLATTSVGARIAVFRRGPVVSVYGRVYVELSPAAVYMGYVHYWTSATVSIQRR